MCFKEYQSQKISSQSVFWVIFFLVFLLHEERFQKKVGRGSVDNTNSGWGEEEKKIKELKMKKKKNTASWQDLRDNKRRYGQC